MLKPHDRKLLFDSLRPPDGYVFDYAVGTTFSLDLLTLLTVPLGFAMADWVGEPEEALVSPPALIEALRSQARRMAIFCQAGQISVPRHRQVLYGYLEGSVHQVIPPFPGGVFHPKVWVLRFADDDGEVAYRVLVLSRNLTPDRSWDTLLRLDGNLRRDRRNAFSMNHPLGDFVQALPDMTVQGLDGEVREAVRRIAEEIRRVEFEIPEPFEKVTFHPVGLSTGGSWPFAERMDRVLVMSPFASPEMIERITSKGKGHILITRTETLDKLGRRPFDLFDRVFVLHDAANPEGDPDVAVEEGGLPADDAPDSVNGTAAQPAGAASELTGLHAKLFVADHGWYSTVWTGSANATNAAFARNVEFLVELTGKKRRYGIDALLAEGEDTSLRSLLCEAAPSENGPKEDADREALEQRLDELRRALASSRMVATVMSADGDDDEFHVRLDGHVLTCALDTHEESVICWPITQSEQAAAVPIELTSVDPPQSTVLAQWGPLSFEALTSFYAFRIRIKRSNLSEEVRFVLNVPLEGIPPNRDERILRSVLKNQQQLVRYLLYLLSEGDIDRYPELMQALQAEASAAREGREMTWDIPLFEALVRSLEYQPQKIERVARLVEDLKRTPDGEALLPTGFDAIWEPIWAAHKEGKP